MVLLYAMNDKIYMHMHSRLKEKHLSLQLV
jgi:hypothetical protein